MVKVSVDQQAWLSKMKLIALQNVPASQEAELNEDEDILNLKVNELLSNRHFVTILVKLTEQLSASMCPQQRNATQRHLPELMWLINTNAPLQ